MERSTHEPSAILFFFSRRHDSCHGERAAEVCIGKGWIPSGAFGGVATSFITHLRVENDLEEIDQKIQKDDQRCIKKDRADDQAVIAVERRLHEKPSETGNIKNGFDDERAADESSSCWSEKRDDRKNADPQRMF